MQFEVAQIQFTFAKNNFALNLFYACALCICRLHSHSDFIAILVLHDVISTFFPCVASNK